MKNYQYIGSELELFKNAHNWKLYWSNKIKPYLHGDILEVGAGIGANLNYFKDINFEKWVALEPDKKQFKQIAETVQKHPLFNCIHPVLGKLKKLKNKYQFDSILYIDTLEHIENDRNELILASELLKKNGKLIILSPAYNWLYSEFDKSIGHFKRYDKKQLLMIKPASLGVDSIFYLDSFGVLASLGNKLILKKNLPNSNQIRFWDAFLVPISIISDSIFRFKFGKSVVAIFTKV